MAEVKLTAQVRTDFGKGAARRARRADLVPAVIYGHGAEPQHVAINNHALMMALKTPNALLRLEFDGKNELVIPKAVQREAIRGFLVHADFLAVKKGEKVNVELPIHTEGELAPGGNLLEYVLNTLPVEAEATHIPESVTISIAGLDAGHSVQAKDIALPAGVSLAVEDDAVVLQIVAAQAEAPAEEAAEGEGAEGAEA
ncbi:50S ribosomal protein L25/general stress protein Ctc [Streptomyces sp. Je 1-4]|uniref:50S ribosomal protein L25/general stress protein Ctc n=1 Tax=Streptomyces TaxID=1883 RepID=UPI00140F3F67|nr:MULTISPECIES: 50S ribosomal protein L25/general stress protein Ctc [unclassified Streptomyces]QIK08365.1 50S ribosomal protein L25/general stress protein Ctc [Streptomyces sp. ID38640]UYB42006.1 50S ribosomal protein L25/general stress protein Ctc [Streptomyces sp. Je 1-4]UZQ38281.1 50S ribosomal protein L25/general stress protein Ctc [Streptomyces sp. Je 1-4] [Streptomyces sp. Je 1-4 4N24]UZQ45698.1 50S ribosomal protein L25/general stress protein Ctc [Streptomyces sp. Je 1-4] [Streptomyces